MRLVSGLLAVLLLVGTTGRETSAQQASGPTPEQVALFQAFAALTTDEARQAFVEATPSVRTQEFASAMAAWARVLNPIPARFPAWNSVEWLARQTGPPRLIPAAMASRAAAHGLLGRYDATRAELERAVTLAEPLGDRMLTHNILTNLGTALGHLGDWQQAILRFDQAIELGLELKQPLQESTTYNSLGNYYAVRGDHQRAHQWLRRALELRPDDEGEGTRMRATTLSAIGNLYLDVGDYPQAIRHFEDALALSRKVKASNTSFTLSSLGNALRHSDPARAQSYLIQAMAEAQRVGDAGTAATVLSIQGMIARDAERWDEAVSMFTQSLALHEGGNNRRGIAETLSDLADIARRRGNLDAAEAYLRRSIDDARQSGFLPALIRSLVGLAEVEERRDRLASALVYYGEAEQTLELLRQQSVGAERAQQQFLSYRLAAYLGAAAVHVKQRRFVDALLATERARARTLLGIVETGRPGVTRMTDDERARERDLVTRLATVSMELAQARRPRQPDAARIADLERQLTRARLEREAFVDALYAAKPAVGLARGQTTVATPAALASLLPQRTGAVSFVIEPTRAWRYIVTSSASGLDVVATQLPADASDLVQLATRFGTQVANRDLGFASTAKQLRTVLFSGLEPWLERLDHLIVIPDGALWQVPFQALQDSTGQFLVERLSVSYAPSLSALSALTTRQTARPRRDVRVLALGDPATVANDARLPEASREVQAVGQIYGASRSVVLTGPAASETALRTGIGQASVVHIATHGELDDVSPMYSSLRLTSSGSRDPLQDGRLEASDWLELDLTADLVVLSACETAGAPTFKGEGLIGQTWALFAAGASSAVVSQWAVDSSSTTDLMIAFHKRYRGDGKARIRPSVALRDAALTVMKDSRYRHPFYWAGFSVVGVR